MTRHTKSSNVYSEDEYSCVYLDDFKYCTPYLPAYELSPIINYYLGYNLITILQLILCVDRLITGQWRGFLGEIIVCGTL